LFEFAENGVSLMAPKDGVNSIYVQSNINSPGNTV